MKKVTNEVCFRLIKMCDIIYIAIISIFIGFLLAHYSDKLFGKFDSEYYEKLKKENSKLFYREIFTKMAMTISYSSILLYISRNLYELIPSPFHGICNFDHFRVREVHIIPVTIYFLFFNYQYDLFRFVSKNID